MIGIKTCRSRNSGKNSSYRKYDSELTIRWTGRGGQVSLDLSQRGSESNVKENRSYRDANADCLSVIRIFPQETERSVSITTVEARTGAYRTHLVAAERDLADALLRPSTF